MKTTSLNDVTVASIASLDRYDANQPDWRETAIELAQEVQHLRSVERMRQPRHTDESRVLAPLPVFLDVDGSAIVIRGTDFGRVNRGKAIAYLAFAETAGGRRDDEIARAEGERIVQSVNLHAQLVEHRRELYQAARTARDLLCNMTQEGFSAGGDRVVRLRLDQAVDFVELAAAIPETLRMEAK